MESPDTRTHILQTAVLMIGKEKNLKPTTREIASRAGVNIAAINYYFRSKKDLLEEAEMAMGYMLTEIYDILEKKGVPVQEKLKQWAEEMMQFILAYPGFIYALGIKVFEKDNQILSGYITAAEQKLVKVMEEAGFDNDPSTAARRTQQLMACVIYPVLIHSGIGQDPLVDIHRPEEREKYLESVFSCIMRNDE